MTHYNRKTYKVDDVDFTKTARDTFTNQNGEAISFADYYRDQYSIVLEGEQLDQPLLFSKAKIENTKKGMKGDALLIPCLCFPTGLSDEMRANFDLMRTLSSHLHMDPGSRKRMMDEFLERFHTDRKVQEELKNWKVELGSEYITVPGRVLDKEKISIGNPHGGENLIKLPDEKADWTRGLKGNLFMVDYFPRVQYFLVVLQMAIWWSLRI